MHGALALDVDHAALLEQEPVPQAVIDVVGHLNSAFDVGGLHAGRDVHGVAPDVVEELAGTDHSGHHGACGHSDAQRHLPAPRIFEIGHGVGHVERQRRQRLEMVGPRRRDPADHHVRIAAGLDLLQAVPVDQRIEVGVEQIQEPHQVGRRRVAGALGVAGDVGEQDRRVVVFVGDHTA